MKSHHATSDLLWFIHVPSLNLLPLTPCWILNEICMADARQQDVKEEAGGTLGKVRGRSLCRQESWSHLKGRLGWTPPWKSESVRQTMWRIHQRRRQDWIAPRNFFSNKIYINEYLTLNCKKRIVELIENKYFNNENVSSTSLIKYNLIIFLSNIFVISFSKTTKCEFTKLMT